MSIDKLKHREVTGLILKSFYEIYNELGNGFLESVYENAMAVVLHQYGLNTETQRDITVYFRRHIVGNFRADIIWNLDKTSRGHARHLSKFQI